MHAWTQRWLVTIGGAGMVAAWLGSGGCSPSSDRPPAAAAESPAIPAPAAASRLRPRGETPLVRSVLQTVVIVVPADFRIRGTL
jgi:hypothetical protein